MRWLKKLTSDEEKEINTEIRTRIRQEVVEYNEKVVEDVIQQNKGPINKGFNRKVTEFGFFIINMYAKNYWNNIVTGCSDLFIGRIW